MALSSTIQKLSKLKYKKYRDLTGNFIAEGPQAVFEAVKFACNKILAIYVLDAAQDEYPHIFHLANAAQLPINVVSYQEIKSLSSTVHPQGVLAVCKKLNSDLSGIFTDSAQLILVAHNIRDPGNAGILIRIADDCGCAGYILSGKSVDSYNSKVVRSSTGSIFHIPIAITKDFAEIVNLAQKFKFNIFQL